MTSLTSQYIHLPTPNSGTSLEDFVIVFDPLENLVFMTYDCMY